MSVARVAVLAVATSGLLCGTAGAAGPYRPFQSGYWSGGAYTDDRNGSFTHCSAGVAYDSGINLFIAITRSYGWALGFANPEWALTSNASIPVELRFDTGSPLKVAGTVASGQLVLVPMPNNSRLIETFQGSSKLNAKVQTRSLLFDVAGASRTMTELTSCVRNSLALERLSPPLGPPQGRPDASPRPDAAQPTKPSPVTGLEEVELAKNFLLAAQLPNARMVNADKPPALAGFSAVWRSDNAAGAVKIISPGPDATGVGIASNLIFVDPQSCKGKFDSARSSEIVDGEAVFRASLSCTDEQDERTVQYFIAPRQKGGFVVFAVVASTPAKGVDAAAERKEIDLFRRAALRAVAPGG